MRSRVVNEWVDGVGARSSSTCSSTRCAPELHPARDEKDDSRFDFGGFDLVSDASKLQYAFGPAGGGHGEFGAIDSLSYNEAAALTEGGARELVLYAKDEAGNVGSGAYHLEDLNGFHGRSTAPSAGGCACDVSGRDNGRGGMLAMFLVALVLLRRRAKALAPFVVVGLIAFVAAGCGCDNKNSCSNRRRLRQDDVRHGPGPGVHGQPVRLHPRHLGR